MAKSIKELSYEVYPREKYRVYNSTENKREGFIEGANAVLEEIEQAIKDCDVDGSPYVAVLDRIKQLKEEE